MNPINVVVGNSVKMSIQYLDQNGTPMNVTPVPDSPHSGATLTPLLAIWPKLQTVAPLKKPSSALVATP